jgi:CheY-like chemotaxis protein
MKRLLIVEDSEQFRRMIVSLLKGYYDEIYECSDGKDAKAAYAKYKPDWVLMDIEMREMDGLTATKKIKSAYPEARVVIMTQYQDMEIQKEARLVGAEKFVLKDNISDIRKIIGGRRITSL